MAALVSVLELVKHRPEYGYGSGEVIGCQGCTWKPNGAYGQQRWIEYVDHLQKVVEAGTLVLSGNDIDWLREMLIDPGSMEKL